MIDYEVLKSKILSSENIESLRDDCRPPIPSCGENQNYIFISYSHKDYKSVYCDLLELHKAGVRFWYDYGLAVGKNWDSEVESKMKSRGCAGIIFYLSENLVLSPSINKEVCNVLGGDDGLENRRNYFCISLSNALPKDLIWDTLRSKSRSMLSATGITDINKHIAVLSNAFPNEMTNIIKTQDDSTAHLGKLIETIETLFNVKRNITYVSDEIFDNGILDQWEQYKLGFGYEFGDGAEKNYEKAVYWYHKSAEQGNAWSQNRLGDCYLHGKGVAENAKKAVEWYTKAANQGDATAQLNLGYCYRNGNGVSADCTIALAWYLKSAEQGNCQAQYAVGFSYEFGVGTFIDYEKAVYWYRKSAEQGEAWSQNRLGDCFFHGNGVQQDYQKAFLWYEKAANQNDVTACTNLAVCYENGYGVARNLSAAQYWRNHANYL